MERVPVCKYCGKPYKRNEKILEDLPDFIKQQITFIPDCDCFVKLKEKEMEEAEKERIKECVKNRVNKYKEISIIDEKFKKSTFENAEMSDKHMLISKKFAMKVLEKQVVPKGILMYGNVGTGKTFASNCIANYLMEHGRTVLVMNLGLYLNKLQREWAEAEKDVLNYVETCDLLVIDDFGVEKTSPFVLEKTFTLIDKRYRTSKPMIITTNLDMQEIENKFGSRISDRITEMCYPLAVVGKSKRKPMSNDEFLEFLK